MRYIIVSSLDINYGIYCVWWGESFADIGMQMDMVWGFTPKRYLG